MRFLSSADRYDPDKLEYDKQLVTDFYNSNGYPEFRFISSIAQLSINKNDFVGIIGSSGSGKTSLVNLICGVYENYKGDIFVKPTSLIE